MKSLLYISVVLLAFSSAFAQDSRLPRKLGEFHLRHAAFVLAYEKSEFSSVSGDKHNLFISTFDPLEIIFNDPVYEIKTPGKYLDFISSWDELLQTLTENPTAVWPNAPYKIPKEIAGFDGLLQTSGFLVPGKQDGQLEVYNVETNPVTGPWNIAGTDEKTWSYHDGKWKDIDGDGLMDILTARFHVKPLGGTISELVWFKNPGNLGADGTNWSNWEQFTLIEGPDVLLSLTQLEAEGVMYDVLVTGELWSNKVMLYYVVDAPGAWADPSNIMSTVIDDTQGKIFEARFVDINMDGILEVTCSSIDETALIGSFYMYTMPADFRTPYWERTVLATGFIPNFESNSMTPGKHEYFYPSEEYANQESEFGPMKPWIALAGDDDGRHYLLFPQSEDRGDFNYDKVELFDTGKDTTGTVAIADLDGDGYNELIFAGFSASTVYVYTYAP